MPGFLLIQSIIHATCVQAGNTIRLLLHGLKHGDVERGQVSIPDFFFINNITNFKVL